MKTNLIRTLLSTAVVLSLSAAVYAQEPVYVHIPFSFAMNGKMLPAGKYRLTELTKFSNAVLSVEGNKESAFAIANPSIDKDTRARLVFRCGETGNCTLVEVWNYDGRGWKVPMHRVRTAEKERLAVVYTDRKNAE